MEEFKRTEATLNKMAEALNNSEVCQDIMQQLGKKAVELGMTVENWNQFKSELLFNLFVDLARKDNKVMNDLALDTYEAIRG